MNFDIGQRVRILRSFNNVVTGMVGEVIDFDAYTVDVRLPVATEEMKGYGDCKTGVVSVEPKDLEIVPVSAAGRLTQISRRYKEHLNTLEEIKQLIQDNWEI